MTGAAALCLLGVACVIVALVGKSVKVGSVQLPEVGQKWTRVGMAFVGIVSLAIGLLLNFRLTQQPASADGVISHTPALSSTSPGNSSQSSPTPGETSAPAPSPASSVNQVAVGPPMYLASMIPSDGDVPRSDTWSINGHPYTHSIGYDATCASYSTSYLISGHYQYFEATAGVDDGAPEDDQGPTVEFTIYANPGGGQPSNLPMCCHLGATRNLFIFPFQVLRYLLLIWTSAWIARKPSWETRNSFREQNH